MMSKPVLKKILRKTAFVMYFISTDSVLILILLMITMTPILIAMLTATIVLGRI